MTKVNSIKNNNIDKYVNNLNKNQHLIYLLNYFYLFNYFYQMLGRLFFYLC